MESQNNWLNVSIHLLSQEHWDAIGIQYKISRMTLFTLQQWASVDCLPKGKVLIILKLIIFLGCIFKLQLVLEFPSVHLDKVCVILSYRKVLLRRGGGVNTWAFSIVLSLVSSSSVFSCLSVIWQIRKSVSSFFCHQRITFFPLYLQSVKACGYQMAVGEWVEEAHENPEAKKVETEQVRSSGMRVRS